MKNKYLIILCALLTAVCGYQQWYIQARVTSPKQSDQRFDTSNMPDVTWDFEALNLLTEPPLGANSCSESRDTTRLAGNYYRGNPMGSNPSGFDASLTIDVKDVDFSPWRDAVYTNEVLNKREEIIRKIAYHYAQQIAASVLGGKIKIKDSAHRPASTGVVSHSCNVHHPYGYMTVSAGYQVDESGSVTDLVAVNVISRTLTLDQAVAMMKATP